MKQKTHKATAKRFKITKGGKGTKTQKRTAGQNHFNTRENGKVGRNKKSDKIDSNNPKVNRTIKRNLAK
jgi:ribosomal protein L35